MKRFFEIVLIGSTIAASGCGSNNSNLTTFPPVQQDPNNPYFANNCYQGYNGNSVMVVRTNPVTGQREFGYIPRNLYTDDYARRVAAGEVGLAFCPVNYGSFNYGLFGSFVSDYYHCGNTINGFAFYIPFVASVPWWGYGHYNQSWHVSSGRYWWKFKFRTW